MAQVLIRGLEPHVIDVFKRRAAIHGKSLEQVLRDTLTVAAQLTGAERAALVAEVRAMTPHGPSGVDSTLLIRASRDSR